MTDVAPDQMLGRTLLDRYVIESKLGEGGMGAVYLARHLVLEKRVALKVLHAELQRKPDLVERFLNEAKSASRIRHENVIDITDFGTAPDGTVFFAMELLEGRDLHDVMTHAALDGQRLPWSRTRNIFLQVCAALTAAHKAGILHRDLKPENIYLVEWLGHPDFVKLLDFGIAKSTEVLEEGRKLTRTGMLFGTPEYMAPEQARGEKVDARVDVYAMGCILYQLISGRVPFEGDSFMAVLSKHLSEEAASIEAEAAEVGAPAGVTEVITKALSKDRDERYDTIDELAMAVRMADRRAGRHSVAPPFHTTAESPVVQVPAAAAARGKNRAALSIALAGIVAAAAAVGAVLVMKNRGDDPTTPGAIAIDAGATAKTPAPQPDPAPEAKGREPEPVAPAIDAGVAGAAHAKVPHARPTPVPTPTPTVTPTVTPAVTPKQPTSPTPDEEEPEIGNVKPKDPFGSGQGTPP